MNCGFRVSYVVTRSLRASGRRKGQEYRHVQADCGGEVWKTKMHD